MLGNDLVPSSNSDFKRRRRLKQQRRRDSDWSRGPDRLRNLRRRRRRGQKRRRPERDRLGGSSYFDYNTVGYDTADDYYYDRDGDEEEGKEAADGYGAPTDGYEAPDSGYGAPEDDTPAYKDSAPSYNGGYGNCVIVALNLLQIRIMTDGKQGKGTNVKKVTCCTAPFDCVIHALLFN